MQQAQGGLGRFGAGALAAGMHGGRQRGAGPGMGSDYRALTIIRRQEAPPVAAPLPGTPCPSHTKAYLS